jgi:isopenicillin N synthase-like dioxygenase
VSVPVVDLGEALAGGRTARMRAAAAIDSACRDIGFFAIDGHGVSALVVDDLRRAAHAFFAQPPAVKLAARHPVAGTNRGYHAAGGEALSAAMDAPTPPDLKEFFHVGPVDVGADAYYTSAEGRQHFTPNVWPVAPADFEHVAIAYYRAMSALIRELMRLAALALSVDETSFDDKIDRSIGTMRLNYYPAQHGAPVPGSCAQAPTPTTAASRSSAARTCPAVFKSERATAAGSTWPRRRCASSSTSAIC